MKFALLPAALLFLAAHSQAQVVILGPTNQTFGLTGAGANAQGLGQSTITWGTCAFDGTNNTCTISGPFNGLPPNGTSGIYTFAITYPGSAGFPLAAVAQSGSSQFTLLPLSNNYTVQLSFQHLTDPPVVFTSLPTVAFQFLNPQCAGVGTCNPSQVGLTPGATMLGPVQGNLSLTTAAPVITPNGAVTPSDYGPVSTSIAPGSWMAIYGSNLAPSTSLVWDNFFNGTTAPTSLNGTSVSVAGVPAYVSYAGSGQVNVQVPTGIQPGPQPLVLTTASGSTAPYTITVVAVEPGLLAPSVFNFNNNQYILAQFANTSTFVLPPGVSQLTSARAKPGDTLTIYGIGFGPVTPNVPAGQITPGASTLQPGALTVSIGGVDAHVAYAGLTPSVVGLYQFNVIVPSIPPSDTTPVTFTFNGTPGAQTNILLAVGN